MQSKLFWYWWLTLIAQLPFIKSSPTSSLCLAESPLTCLTLRTSWRRPGHLGCSSTQNVCVFVSHEKDVVFRCGFAFWTLSVKNVLRYEDLWKVSLLLQMFCRWWEEPSGFHSTVQTILSFTMEAKVFRSGRPKQLPVSVARHELHKKPPTADFLPKTWLHTPKGTAGKEQWYLQTLPSYAAWLALHTLRCKRRIWGTFSHATTWPKFRLKLPKFIIPVRGVDEGDARDSFLKQCTVGSNLSQSWYLSPIIFLRSSAFLFLLT